MRTVRGKLLFIVGLCVVPMALSTLFISAALEREQRDDAAAAVRGAKLALVAELEDNAADLESAARVFAKDSAAVDELARGDRAALFTRLAHFTEIYPGMRVVALDGSGNVVASSVQQETRGSMAKEPLVSAALRGRSVEAAARLRIPGEAPGLYYAIARPVGPAKAPVGALVAALQLDSKFFTLLAAKVNLGFALLGGGGHSPQAFADPDLPLDVVKLVKQGSRTLAVLAFTPPRLEHPLPPQKLVVDATLDLTELTRDHRRFLLYRLAALLVVAAMAVAVALHLAAGMHKSVAALDEVLPGVAQRRYQLARVVPTGDELQRLAETYNGMIGELKEGELWRRALGKYLSRAALEAVKKGELHLGGTLLPSTVLFSDIRGFTALSENMDPVQVLGVLNRYFTEMVSAVIRHDGIVDKFIGDAIMAVWGPPTPNKDDALNAVRAALSMRERLAKLNVEFEKAGQPVIRTGIGIHSGPVVAGNMGAEGTEAEDGEAAQAGKMEYTVIGDAVNLASRLESLTKELHADVLISEDTYALVRDRVRVEALHSVQVKGRTRAVVVYRLLGLAEEERVA